MLVDDEEDQLFGIKKALEKKYGEEYKQNFCSLQPFSIVSYIFNCFDN